MYNVCVFSYCFLAHVSKKPYLCITIITITTVTDMAKIYTYYQTNERNILGGYMTYPTLAKAFDALNPERGVNTITAVTMVNSEWWHGKHTGYLCEVLSKGVIYRA